MYERIDLHTHSNCSDGALSPAALVALAVHRRVELLALTDHDSVGGCDAARAACAGTAIRFVAGAELSCQWRDREIHVVGLELDTGDAELRTHFAVLLERRRERMQAMTQRLGRAGLPGPKLAEMTLSVPLPTRTHLARALCELGVTADVQQAFDRWLKRGRPGYVAAEWPTLETAVQRIRGAGGIPVLAHPHRYQMSHGVLRELAAEFKAAGGLGLEVSLPGMAAGDADRAASLARRFDLAGSVGSDFHEPDLPWRPLGRFAKLPDLITPIAARLEP
jgi:predicted metal-dependent phosphoesterase TrpH